MNRTIIINSCFDDLKELLKKAYINLQYDGSCFISFKTEYDDKGNVTYDIFDVINYATSINYEYVNTIVYPTRDKNTVSFNDNVAYIVWLCKNKKNMFFNKDLIREKHIWKDVEWGKRTKNYNALGKDPGNVWIPTIDDGKAHIVGHVLMSEKDVFNRIIKMTESENSYEIINGKLADMVKKTYSVKHQVKGFDRELRAEVYFSTSENMNCVANNSIKTIVTSPPYWDLKDYYKDGQIGQESYEQYINRMSKVWNECFKKLTYDGSLWININIRVHNNKVILIPYDIINSCKKIGFYYKGIVIWHKSSGIPAGPKNICDHHEYVLVFSKNEDFIVNSDVQSQIRDYKNDDINYGAFWNINRKAGSVGKKYKHPAIYPNDLVSRIVGLSSDRKDIVLDPFLGSGTSLIASINEDRLFVGYEYNEGFKELMSERFSKELNSSIKIIFK